MIQYSYDIYNFIYKLLTMNYFNNYRPLIKLAPLNLIATEIYCTLINDEFAEVAYDASIAGLSCILRANEDNMFINISGYNDKSSLLLESILTMMKDFVIKPKAFNLAKEKLKRYYNNRKLGS